MQQLFLKTNLLILQCLYFILTWIILIKTVTKVSVVGLLLSDFQILIKV